MWVIVSLEEHKGWECFHRPTTILSVPTQWLNLFNYHLFTLGLPKTSLGTREVGVFDREFLYTLKRSIGGTDLVPYLRIGQIISIKELCTIHIGPEF